MTLRWRKKYVLFKLETTYGVDSTPIGANAVQTIDGQLMPMEGTDFDRALETPYMGAQPTIPVDLHMKIRFKVELAPSGTAGTAPGWGPLLRACAMAETVAAGTSVTYNAVTDSHESGSLYFQIEGTRYAMLGTRGNCVLEFSASSVPYLQFEFTGLFTLPSEQSPVTPNYSAFKKPLVVNNANTTFEIDSNPFVMRRFTLDLGNEIAPEFLVGEEGIEIVDKAERIQTTIRATPLTTFDPYAAASDQTEHTVALVHGKTAGNIATLAIAKGQLQRPQGLENTNKITEWSLGIIPVPNNGNDQFTLVLT